MRSAFRDGLVTRRRYIHYQGDASRYEIRNHIQVGHARIGRGLDGTVDPAGDVEFATRGGGIERPPEPGG